MWSDQLISANKWFLTIPIIRPSIFLSPEVEFINHHLNSQLVEFKNKIIGKKCCKILNRWKLSTINTGRNIAKFSKCGIYKPRLQAGILKNSKETRVVPYKNTLSEIWTNWRWSEEGLEKTPPLRGGTETIVWNICSYQVPEVVGTSYSTNEKYKLYNSTVQAIPRGGGDCTTNFGSMCACFVDIGSPVKTQVENSLSKIFNFWVQTIDVSE